jgi:hypothetical protein
MNRPTRLNERVLFLARIVRSMLNDEGQLRFYRAFFWQAIRLFRYKKTLSHKELDYMEDHLVRLTDNYRFEKGKPIGGIQ